jgi:DNA polymerase III subunit alpha
MIWLEQYQEGLRETGELRGLPVCGLGEDDHGDRWLITDLPVPEGIWFRAVGSRAIGIMTEGRLLDLAQVEQLPRGNGLILPGSGPSVVPQRQSRPFVHLHAHSEYSSLDGLAKVDEMLEAVVADGQEYMGLTDHGTCAGHLGLNKLAKKAGVKPIFGIEAYFVEEARNKNPLTRNDYWHLILLAQNDTGLRNLWRASTMANSPDRFYQHPRMDWSVLQECNEGIIVSTACLRGPLADLILNGDEDGAMQRLARLQAIFGERVVLELGTNHIHGMQKDKWVSQLDLNQGLVSLSKSMSVPLIVVSDSHYACVADKDAHQIWLAAQTNKTLQDETGLFEGDQDYHMHSSAEVLHAIDYLGADVAEAAMAHTVEIAKSCDASVRRRSGTPVYHRYEIPGSELQGIELDNDRMVKLCEEAWSERLIPDAQPGGSLYAEYKARFDEEVAMFVTKQFCGYQLIVWDFCKYAHEHNVLMGAGRGSAAGSLVCNLLGITQIDPIEAGLLFERYISPGRTELPDIDSDFPASKRFFMIDYLVERWGLEHVVRVGTVTRLRNKGVFKEVAKVLKGSPDEVPYMVSEAISDIIGQAERGTAGLGLSWEELWDHVGDLLDPYKQAHPKLFFFAEILVGRLKSYGKHPAGVVIDPLNSLTDLPMRQGEEDHPVTEFPMDQLDELGLVKFDILTLRTLDTVQEVLDLIEDDPALRGKIPHPHKWREEFRDPLVWDMLCAGDTLGIFQIETPDGTRFTKQFQPRDIADLSAIGALVRPGPRRSGMSDSYLSRRAGRESVSYAHPLLEDVLDRSYGLMIYQEDIMKTTRVIAGYTSEEADEVRKILGKKQVDKIVAEGMRFRARAADMGIDEAIAEHMFNQMAEFAKYSFNRSHSWSYAVDSFWTAWYKAHFPAHFLVACLSTADKDRFPEYVAEARRRGYRIDLPDVNESEATFVVSHDRLGVRYGLSSIKGLGESAATAIIANRPYSTWDDFVERRGAKCNWGHIRLMAEVGALDSLIPEGHNRVDLQAVVEVMATGKLEQCQHLRLGATPQEGIESCCAFDWANEPVEVGLSGKPKKAKPLPKKCTKACRQYAATDAVHWDQNAPLTDRAVRVMEREKFGLYITSTPFDRLNLSGTGVSLIHEMTDMGMFYTVVGEVRSIRHRDDSFSRKMAFLTLTLVDGTLDVVVFSSDWKYLSTVVYSDSFGLFVVRKNERGFTLHKFIPLEQE